MHNRGILIFSIILLILLGVYILLSQYSRIFGIKASTVNNNVLDLSNRNLEKIPDYVFKQTELESLNVSNNRLSGSVQGEIRFLSNLVEFDLSNNLMTGVPAEIGQLVSLKSLNLSNNQITGLPMELGNLQKLETLNISGNNYSEADLNIILKSLPVSLKLIK